MCELVCKCVYSVGFVVTKGHQTYMCYIEIGLCAHNIDIFLGLVNDTIGNGYVII